MGFRKCCMSNDMKGREDHVLWEEDHGENLLCSDETVGIE
jgi:hypothetical protein